MYSEDCAQGTQASKSTTGKSLFLRLGSYFSIPNGPKQCRLFLSCPICKPSCTIWLSLVRRQNTELVILLLYEFCGSTCQCLIGWGRDRGNQPQSLDATGRTAGQGGDCKGRGLGRGQYTTPSVLQPGAWNLNLDNETGWQVWWF